MYGAKWAEVSQKSKPFMDFYFETARKTFDITTALGKKLLAQKLLPLLASMANKVEQSHWVGEIALALKTKEEVLYKELAAAKPRGLELPEESGSFPSQRAGSPAASLDPTEETLLSLIVKKPGRAQKINPEGKRFFSEHFWDLAQNFK